MTAKDVQQQLDVFVNPEKRDFLPYFFKTGKGQYGEGDKFLGVVVPDIRKVAKQNKDLPFAEVEKLLDSEYHECRMCALLILVDRFKKTKTEGERKLIFNFYLTHTSRINNWDLVDLSCRDIVGEYLIDKPERNILYKLSESKLLWEQRIAMISTYAFIRKGDFSDTIKLATIFLTHKHDLMHKASGWMLREMGKRDELPLIEFLDEYAHIMPRTMLRYSIEKFEPKRRLYYLNKKE